LIVNIESLEGVDIIKKNIQRKIVVLIILFLFIVLSIFPAIQSLKLQINNSENKSENNDKIPIFKQIGPVGTYEDYITSREDKPFFIKRITEPVDRTDSSLVIVFVEDDIISDLSDEIALYNVTLKNSGYDTIIYQVSGATPQDLKDTIITLVESGYNVTGTVLIGDLPTEWFHHENDFYGSSEFPCDLYLMDLDGSWLDTDGDEMYDSHTDGKGDTAPEIFVGRIDASNIPGNEINILKKYFSKVYDFWSGATNYTEYGLTYTDQDWANIDYFRHDIQYAYEDYEAVWYPDVDRDDYVLNRIPNTYEFIQLSCHSSSQGHSFAQGGWASNDEIREAPPNALFFNLFCCSSLRFTDYNCLGYSYILDTDTPSLTVVGSAKTGSMLDFRYFYEPIGDGLSFGTAFRKWFEYEYPYSESDISWFYGMTILGDPTLILKNQPPHGTNFTGPDFGIIGQQYEFCIEVIDPNSDKIYCIFDWGDNTDSEWLGPFDSGDKVCASHSWEEIGEYSLCYKLRDSRGFETGWSDPFIFKIVEDNPPYEPAIEGPNSGKPGITYDYTLNAEDPDGDELRFIIDWGDNTSDITDYTQSGTNITATHYWADKDTYILKVKAEDLYGFIGPEITFEVIIPRTREDNHLLLAALIERFPILERILTLIIR
jgi:hypothetical protein